MPCYKPCRGSILSTKHTMPWRKHSCFVLICHTFWCPTAYSTHALLQAMQRQHPTHQTHHALAQTLLFCADMPHILVPYSLFYPCPVTSHAEAASHPPNTPCPGANTLVCVDLLLCCYFKFRICATSNVCYIKFVLTCCLLWHPSCILATNALLRVMQRQLPIHQAHCALTQALLFMLILLHRICVGLLLCCYLKFVLTCCLLWHPSCSLAITHALSQAMQGQHPIHPTHHSLSHKKLISVLTCFVLRCFAILPPMPCHTKNELVCLPASYYDASQSSHPCPVTQKAN